MQSHYCHSLNPDNSETIVWDEFSWIMITVLPDHTPIELWYNTEITSEFDHKFIDEITSDFEYQSDWY